LLTLGTLVVTVGLSGQSAQDLNAILAQAREALGGEAKLAAVTSLSVSGSLDTTVAGHSSSSTVDYKWQSPDKFVRVRRQVMNLGPLGTGDALYADGYNGDALIREHRVSGPVPAPPDPYQEGSPAEKAQMRARMVNGNRTTFGKFALPLFMASLASFPLEFKTAQTISTQAQGTVIIVTSSAGEWTLTLDRVTHLPARLAWKGKPIVVATTSTTMATQVRPGREPVVTPPGTMAVPSGDPTAGLADVVWEMTIGEYKLADGLNWPHRLVIFCAGEKHEEYRLGKYSINPKLSDNTFAPSK
jgi:hypothetical protein